MPSPRPARRMPGPPTATAEHVRNENSEKRARQSVNGPTSHGGGVRQRRHPLEFSKGKKGRETRKIRTRLACLAGSPQSSSSELLSGKEAAPPSWASTARGANSGGSSSSSLRDLRGAFGTAGTAHAALVSGRGATASVYAAGIRRLNPNAAVPLTIARGPRLRCRHQPHVLAGCVGSRALREAFNSIPGHVKGSEAARAARVVFPQARLRAWQPTLARAAVALVRCRGRRRMAGTEFGVRERILGRVGTE